MSTELMPSSRARAALHQDPVGTLMEEVKLKPQYHPVLRPNGMINLSGALNSLMTDWMATYAEKEPLSMSECLSYGPLTGSQDLLEAAAGYFNRFFTPCEPIRAEHILAANGVTSLMDMVAWTLCDPGQGVLYLTPNFFMLDYNMTVRAGLTTIPVSTLDLSNPFGSNGLSELISALDMASSSALEDRGIECRVLFLCNPTNPQGRCYSPQTLEGLASCILSTSSQKNVHCLYGMSKDFNMGGLRMGFLVTRNPVIKAAASQAAWFTWLTVASDKFVTRFLQQLDVIQDYLDNYCSRLTEAYRRTTTALNKYKIPFQRADAVFAGQFAGCDRPGRFRLVYSQDSTVVELAIQRIGQALDTLSTGQ
uniref:Aminotransferase class I/classII large domain-containing protein n=1 Tax=Fusarium oxysporum (strain Fo5176) TaxID=660025 RepID=A0A0D2XNT5_FUSOF